MDGLARAEKDISAAAAALTQAQERMTQLFRAEVSTEYYAVLVFQSQPQVEAFVKALALKPDDKDPQYLSGTALAKKLGVALPAGPRWRDRDPKFADMALYLDDPEI